MNRRVACDDTGIVELKISGSFCKHAQHPRKQQQVNDCI